jgi:hypothetical protein
MPVVDEVMEEAAEEVLFPLEPEAAEELTFWYWGMAAAMPEKARAATMELMEGILLGLERSVRIRILLIASVVNEWTAEA